MQHAVHSGLAELSPSTLAATIEAPSVARDAALPEPGQTLAQMSYSGRWRVTIPSSGEACVPEAARAAITVRALSLLAERPSLGRTHHSGAAPSPHRMTQFCRDDVRILDRGARPLTQTESLVLAVVLRSLVDWRLFAVSAPGFGIPRQQSLEGREEVRVVSLLGAQDYAAEIWLAASTDPTVPRLAVLAPPHLSPLVQVHLRRALTEVCVLGVSVLLSPGLALTGVADLTPSPPPSTPHHDHPSTGPEGPPSALRP